MFEARYSASKTRVNALVVTRAPQEDGELTHSELSSWERPKRARRCVAQKAAAVEMLGQLPLDVVGEPPAVLGDEAASLALNTALTRTFEGRKNASKKASDNAFGGARGCGAAGRAGGANAKLLP